MVNIEFFNGTHASVSRQEYDQGVNCNLKSKQRYIIR